MKNTPIGIFDSGIGGLTVVSEIAEKLPFEDIIYLGDTLRFPYGTKTPDQLRQFTGQICRYLIEKEVKMIIIACNSASSVALEWAQEQFELPVIGVVEPGARAAFMATVNRRIGVIGTQATVESGAYVKAVHAFDAGLHVFQSACPKFASYVEDGRVDGDDIYEIAENYLKILKKEDIDTLILGCTHYPLLSSLLSKVMGRKTRLINSAEETALEAKEILKRKDILRKDGKGIIKLFSTGPKEKFIELGSRFLGKKISHVEKVML